MKTLACLVAAALVTGCGPPPQTESPRATEGTENTETTPNTAPYGYSDEVPPQRVPTARRPETGPPAPYRPTPPRPAARRPATPRPAAARPAARDKLDALINRLQARTPVKQKQTLIYAVARHKDPRAADALASLLLRSSETVAIRVLAAEQLGRMGAGWTLKSIRKLLAERNTRLKRAARGALARLCPTPKGGTRYYLVIGTLKDSTPRNLQTGRALLMHLARLFATRTDSVVRWPECQGRLPAKITGYELQPSISLTTKQESHTLKASLVILLHTRRALKGLLSAKATFDVEMTRAFTGYLLTALSNSLKQDLDQFLSRAGSRRV